jgi:hypothetical protein
MSKKVTMNKLFHTFSIMKFKILVAVMGFTKGRWFFCDRTRGRCPARVMNRINADDARRQYGLANAYRVQSACAADEQQFISLG